ncbi:MAG: hypothetical protein BWY85_02327 [Firmicutes bacterium ADurb.Bin506]|nr:MAG: hypothetical protein BWY85_02327 [Firmicutes bacterium ADurb.Bin506]
MGVRSDPTTRSTRMDRGSDILLIAEGSNVIALGLLIEAQGNDERRDMQVAVRHELITMRPR